MQATGCSTEPGQPGGDPPGSVVPQTPRDELARLEVPFAHASPRSLPAPVVTARRSWWSSAAVRRCPPVRAARRLNGERAGRPGSGSPGGRAVARAGRRIGLPTIPFFILAGVVFGPHSPGLVLLHEPDAIEVLALLGLVLLLFHLGIEFSVDDLLAGGRRLLWPGHVHRARLRRRHGARLRAWLGHA